MAQVRKTGPYIWVTWLTKLLAGEASCEWAAWFRAQHESWSWSKAPSDFNQSQWLMDHTALLNQRRDEWERQGYTVFTEGQNGFNLRGNTATLGGKPDLIARKRDDATIIDVKTGRPSPAHSIQVMLYQYAIPRSFSQYRRVAFSGQVAYPDHVIDIPADAVNAEFINKTGQLIRRLSAKAPARRVPSRSECAFCDITSADCPERFVNETRGQGVTDDF